MTAPRETVIVADVGNTRIKLAVVVAGAASARLPAVAHRQDLVSREFRAANLKDWLDRAAPGPAIVYAASVHEAAATGLEAAIAEVAATGHRIVRQRRITAAHVGMPVEVDEPERVGIDRVAAAAAAAAAKEGARPAIVIDCGTATTVDLVSADGRFLGGAILPGPGLLARALAEGTSRLPAVADLDTGMPPSMPGRNTQRAIAAGIGFGMRGAVARLVAEAAAAVGGDPQVFLTGGSRGIVRDALTAAIEIPDLVLHGIALAAGRLQSRP
ncbi:MAG: type III pantothenate kinase [Planctomycetes bacterium]|nr:type III pantothenate kinase [Planctomycetota bacterium]